MNTVDSSLSEYDRGRAAGLAIAAVAIGAIAFLQLLGLEKAIAAVVLGAIAVRVGGAGSKTMAYVAVGLGVLYMLILAGTFVFAGDQLLTALGFATD